MEQAGADRLSSIFAGVARNDMRDEQEIESRMIEVLDRAVKSSVPDSVAVKLRLSTPRSRTLLAALRPQVQTVSFCCTVCTNRQSIASTWSPFQGFSYLISVSFSSDCDGSPSFPENVTCSIAACGRYSLGRGRGEGNNDRRRLRAALIGLLEKNGIEHVKILRDGLAAWLDTNRYESVRQMRGTHGLQEHARPAGFVKAALHARRQFMGRTMINPFER